MTESGEIKIVIERWIGQQRYRMAGFVPYRRIDGADTELVERETHCATCGEALVVRVPVNSAKFEPSRRCLRHRQPGRKVKRIAAPICEAVRIKLIDRSHLAEVQP